MGIRYYAYAYDAADTQVALDDPRRILSSDPLADAWGMQPHASVGTPTFAQALPRRDMLYLDKAWSALQAMTAPAIRDRPRAAFRMFEGRVTHHSDGWDAWVRTILPQEVPAIRDDLDRLARAESERRVAVEGAEADSDVDGYVLHYLRSARDFVTGLAVDGRGMVYMIG
ncbi:hypothetical protein [Agromyces sp. SYSU T00266]|uniref:hypothetical protein n=1 Tax=Agromyces zhanjiangensis TaxID=3158562 RepID=UPI0033977B7B